MGIFTTFTHMHFELCALVHKVSTLDRFIVSQTEMKLKKALWKRILVTCLLTPTSLLGNLSSKSFYEVFNVLINNLFFHVK